MRGKRPWSGLTAWLAGAYRVCGPVTPVQLKRGLMPAGTGADFAAEVSDLDSTDLLTTQTCRYLEFQ
jgi:hypothetical protein